VSSFREWRDIMAPTLWELLKVKTTTASSDKLVSLLHLQNGILPHVQALYITCELGEITADSRPEFEAIVQLIVTALPRTACANISAALRRASHFSSIYYSANSNSKSFASLP
jgi:hypothetical protein